VLNAMTHAYHAQLVVVGGQRRGPLARNFGGSTAHHLARTAECPVLVHAPGQTPHRVLAAIDLSAASAPTLASAARYAQLLDAQLRVLYVVEPIRHVSPVPRVLDSAEVAERARREFEKLLDAELPDHPNEERAVRSGLPEEAIAAEAADWGADVIAVGTQGKGLIDRMLIGSTTERLLNRLPASLLIVPGRRGVAKRRAVKPKRRAGRAR
jgi:nucleotide-binding universal stress UspA family protein